MAREVESKAHQRYALWSPRRTGNRERNICVTFLGGSVGGMGPVTANALARLSALQGPEFDAVFANLQVAVQTAAVHQFSAYSQNGTSGPLRRCAKLMLPTSKMFLEYAHRLAASR
jgi:hypothetical protein